jgi:hypothetical protein
LALAAGLRPGPARVDTLRRGILVILLGIEPVVRRVDDRIGHDHLSVRRLDAGHLREALDQVLERLHEAAHVDAPVAGEAVERTEAAAGRLLLHLQLVRVDAGDHASRR